MNRQLQLRRNVIFVCVVVLLAISIPYIAAAQLVGPDHTFGGFFVSSMDGYTYLAKMQLGAAGEWKFHLSYSPYGGEGAYIFLFYIFLGWLANALGIPLLVMFHLARVLASAGLLAIYWRFARWLARDDDERAWRIFLLGVVGSGLGWLASLFFGLLTLDLWVVDAFPFLAMFVTPHYALGMAVFLWMCLLIFDGQESKSRWWLLPLLSLALATVQPFAAAVLALPVASYFLLHRERIFSKDLIAAALAFLPGGLYLIYQFAAINADPLLSQWNAQNVNQSQPWWDMLLGFSPALVLAGFGAVRWWKTRDNRLGVLLFWLIAGLVLIYLPMHFQRRFIFGLFIPISVLAVAGVERLTEQGRRLRWLWPTVMVLSVLTNVLLVCGGMMFSTNRDPRVTTSAAEEAGFAWLRENAPAHSLILASPHLGLYIPAKTGRNVIFGHTFESVGGEVAEKEVETFFAGALDALEAWEYVREKSADYVMAGTDDLLPPGLAESNLLRLEYQQDGISIYKVER